MTIEDLREAFNNGFCIGIDRAVPDVPGPHWFWIKPHPTPNMGLIPRKCGWGSYYEDHIWEQMERDPNKWKIGEEVNGEFSPL